MVGIKELFKILHTIINKIPTSQISVTRQTFTYVLTFLLAMNKPMDMPQT